MRIVSLAALAAAFAFAPPLSAAVIVGIENAGAQQTSLNVTGKTVATFDSYASDAWVGSGDVFGGSTSTIANGGFKVGSANVYGGAGGTGNFATVYSTTTLNLAGPATYFGLWASAIDGDFATSAGNMVELYSGGTRLGSYALKSILLGSGSCPDAGAYCGNPNAAFAGQNAWEPYAFFNFSSDVAFDRVDLVQNGGGGFELDNLTVGNIRGRAGQDALTGAVPEAPTWMMMIGGFGLIGCTMRRRQRERRNAAA